MNWKYHQVKFLVGTGKHADSASGITTSHAVTTGCDISLCFETHILSGGSANSTDDGSEF